MKAVKAPRIRDAVSRMSVAAGGLASQLPGVSFFTDQAPPSFGLLTLMTGGLTLAVFVWVFSMRPSASRRARHGVISVIIAIVLALAYTALLNCLTVSAPPETGVSARFQIGFGLLPFSLTPAGLTAVKTSPGNATAEYLMLIKGAFRPGGAELIWKPWTITAAWLILSGTFVLAYLCWAFGLACIAVRLSDRDQR
jgi:hypothetical protein